MSFTHKLYWRRPRGSALACCFERVGGRGTPRWESLCCRYVIRRSYGQVEARPPSQLRCALCDGYEMDILGLQEGAGENPDWRQQWQHTYPMERLV